MPAIQLAHVSFSFESQHPLFTELDLHLSAGWTGVVGPNGSGKTTLLRLIEGALAPDAGQVRRSPAGALVIRCPQRVDALTPAIQEFAWSWDRASRRWIGRLGLDADALDRWPTLSPGERKRWQIGAALAVDPEILLLDEPTNHLDAGGRAILIEALRRFGGVGLVVSHDRSFLEALCDATLRVRGGDARLWGCPYGAARDAWEAESAETRDRYAAARGRERTARRRLETARQERAAAARSMRSRNRIKGPKDSDGRSVNTKGRIAKAEAVLSRSVQVARGAAERASRETAAFQFEKTVGRSLFVDYAPSPRATLLSLRVDAVCAGDRAVLGPTDLRVGRRDRIWLRGPNGAGKTTLLRALLDDSTLPADRLLYLPQALTAGEGAALLDAARALGRAERGRVFELVAALGADPVRLRDSAQPSPGEARKLALAMGMARQVWGLLLDEPTNHLDLPSIERLEAALRAWPGAMLLVTHDPIFGAKCSETVWSIVDQTVEVGARAA